jgi:hypothetical protein
MMRARKDGAGMRTLTWLGPLLAVVLAGCAAQEPPRPQPPPRRPPAEGPPKPVGNAKYQRDLIMAELVRTHPVLAATLDRDLDKLRAALKKGGKVNEVRPDMRLGPPLREACRLNWKPGIAELQEHGAQCLGDAACERCVRNASETGG